MENIPTIGAIILSIFTIFGAIVGVIRLVSQQNDKMGKLMFQQQAENERVQKERSEDRRENNEKFEALTEKSAQQIADLRREHDEQIDEINKKYETTQKSLTSEKELRNYFEGQVGMLKEIMERQETKYDALLNDKINEIVHHKETQAVLRKEYNALIESKAQLAATCKSRAERITELERQSREATKAVGERDTQINQLHEKDTLRIKQLLDAQAALKECQNKVDESTERIDLPIEADIKNVELDTGESAA